MNAVQAIEIAIVSNLFGIRMETKFKFGINL